MTAATCLSRARSVALACALVVPLAAYAQQAAQQVPDAPAPEDQPTTPADPAPSLAYRPGFLDAVGRWLGNSKDAVDSQIKNTQERIGQFGTQATGAAKDVAGAAQAAGAAIGLPGTRIVTGRQLCTIAPNGGADCQPAAETLCRSKGFQGGKGLEVMTSQKCPTRVWISGRPSDAECRTETHVTRAACL